MKIYEVPIHLVAEIWPGVKDLLARAMKYHRFMDVDDVLTIIREGRATLIVAVNDERIAGVAVMEIIAFPKIKVGWVMALAGERGLYQHMDQIMEWLESWCRQRGCTKISELGRPAWARVAKSRGYEFTPYAQATKSLEAV